MENPERITIITRSSSLEVEIDSPPRYEDVVRMPNTSPEEVTNSNEELRNHLSEQVANAEYQRLENRIRSLEDTTTSLKETKRELTNFIYLLFLIICFGCFYIYRINETNSTLLHNAVDDRVKKEHFCRLLIELVEKYLSM
ncbi:7692_t:CDS:2 [Dentiscutata erythropus]|uniref:7692_t:CDS:1 n=1 Tax=Dentiscutata erythropus TaxID=1348616 RepID=A0A9N9GWU1_9GLOM|nr:7692_t:CDS:2 [Dentiscutata erythropus]